MQFLVTEETASQCSETKLLRQAQRPSQSSPHGLKLQDSTTQTRSETSSASCSSESALLPKSSKSQNQTTNMSQDAPQLVIVTRSSLRYSLQMLALTTNFVSIHKLTINHWWQTHLCRTHRRFLIYPITEVGKKHLQRSSSNRGEAALATVAINFS